MTVTFRPLALREVLGLGRSIVRDFHPYELRGYRYAGGRCWAARQWHWLWRPAAPMPGI